MLGVEGECWVSHMLFFCVGPGHGCPPRPAGTALQEVPIAARSLEGEIFFFCQSWYFLSDT